MSCSIACADGYETGKEAALVIFHYTTEIHRFLCS
jgi:hypothetical protein